MAKIDAPRFFVTLKNTDGSHRFMWRAPAYLRPLGFTDVRLDDDFAAACRRAAELNVEVDNARAGSPRAMLAAQALDRRVQFGTVEHLCQLYKQSPKYASLSKGSRGKYNCAMGKLVAWAGEHRIDDIDEDDCIEWYEQTLDLAAREMARATIIFAGMLWRFGRKCKDLRDMVRVNPWEAVELKRVKRQKDPLLWSRAMIDAFVLMADALGLHGVGTAVLLNAWLGQRQGDVLRLRWSQYRDNRFRFVQRKTDQPMTLWDCPDIEARLEWEQNRRPALWSAMSDRIIVNDRKAGAAFGERGFNGQFNYVRAWAVKGSEQLGLEPCPALARAEFRWLRHTMVTDAAMARMPTVLIASISGHTEQNVEHIIARYRIRTERMAQLAAEMRLESGGLFGKATVEAAPLLPAKAA
jgi:integrase